MGKHTQGKEAWGTFTGNTYRKNARGIQRCTGKDAWGTHMGKDAWRIHTQGDIHAQGDKYAWGENTHRGDEDNLILICFTYAY
jgi:hypothetical protein